MFFHKAKSLLLVCGPRLVVRLVIWVSIVLLVVLKHDGNSSQLHFLREGIYTPNTHMSVVLSLGSYYQVKQFSRVSTLDFAYESYFIQKCMALGHKESTGNGRPVTGLVKNLCQVLGCFRRISMEHGESSHEDHIKIQGSDPHDYLVMNNYMNKDIIFWRMALPG